MSETKKLTINSGHTAEGRHYVQMNFPRSTVRKNEDGSVSVQVSGPEAAYIGTCIIAASRDGKNDAVLFRYLVDVAVQGGDTVEAAMDVASRALGEVRRRRNMDPQPEGEGKVQ